MSTYDTTSINRNEIAADIVESVIAHGTSTEEVLANSGSIENAAQAVLDYYTDTDGIEWPTDQDGDELDVYDYALDYFRKYA